MRWCFGPRGEQEASGRSEEGRHRAGGLGPLCFWCSRGAMGAALLDKLEEIILVLHRLPNVAAPLKSIYI